jgi:hypothetical protein
VASVREAFNVRFDIYEGSMIRRKNDSNYRPAQNVRKGYVGGGRGGSGNSCNARPANNWPIGSPPNQATGLPLDRSWPYMAGASRSGLVEGVPVVSAPQGEDPVFLRASGGRMGNGDWDFSTYWQVNHGADGRLPPPVNGAPASNSNLPSRYSVYRYEIDQGYVTDRSPGGETGAPACYGGGDLPDVPDRRVIYAAIINCQTLGLIGRAQSNVPVAAFGKLFLTLPLSRSQTDIYVESVGLVKPGDKGNYDMVQLYR